MPLFNLRSTTVGDTVNNDGHTEAQTDQSPDAITQARTPSTQVVQDEKTVGTGLQDGIAKIEAATIIWTKRDLIMAYIL